MMNGCFSTPLGWVWDIPRKHFWLTCDLTRMVKVDPGNTGRVAPTEAALFLKKSGLPDATLGKVTDAHWRSVTE